MSSLLETLMGQLDGNAMGVLASQLGANEKQTRAGVAAALPMILAGLSRNAQNSAGAASLSAALDRDHDGSLMGNLAGFLGQGDTSPGQGILGHVFGARQSAVQNGLGQTTGLGGDGAAKLMAMLAPLVLGALGQAKRQGNLDPGKLAGMLGQERQAIEKHAPGQLGMLNALMDADGDGDVDLSDIVKRGGGMLGKLFGQ